MEDGLKTHCDHHLLFVQFLFQPYTPIQNMAGYGVQPGSVHPRPGYGVQPEVWAPDQDMVSSPEVWAPDQDMVSSPEVWAP